jgi:hypothetical protein
MAKSPKKETTTNIALDMAKIFLDIQTKSFSSGVEEGRRQAQQELAARIDEKIKDLEEEKIPQSENTQEFDPYSNYTDDKLDEHIKATKKLLDGDDE